MTPNHLGTMLSPVDQARADAWHGLLNLVREARKGRARRYWYDRARESVRGYAELEREFADVWAHALVWAQAEIDHHRNEAAGELESRRR